MSDVYPKPLQTSHVGETALKAAIHQFSSETLAPLPSILARITGASIFASTAQVFSVAHRAPLTSKARGERTWGRLTVEAAPV